MKANMKVLAGLLLALAAGAPAYAQSNEDGRPAQPHNVPAPSQGTNPSGSQIVDCLNDAKRNHADCQSNAKSNSGKAACDDGLKNATLACNVRVNKK